MGQVMAFTSEFEWLAHKILQEGWDEAQIQNLKMTEGWCARWHAILRQVLNIFDYTIMVEYKYTSLSDAL